MSSIPGIDSRAPERTETSSGSSLSPSVLPACSSRRPSASATSSAMPVGLLLAALHVGDAGLGRDREARRAPARRRGRASSRRRSRPCRRAARACRASRRRSRRPSAGRCPPRSGGSYAQRAHARAGARRRGARASRGSPARPARARAGWRRGSRPAGARAPRPGSRGRPRRAGTRPPRRPCRPRRRPRRRSREVLAFAPQAAQAASCGAKPAASSSLSRKASALARAGPRRVGVEQRELVGEQVVDAGVRVAVVEQPADRVAGAGGGVERAAVLAQARVAGDRLGGRDREQVAAALVEHEVEAEERLQAAAEARLGAPHALGDGAQPPAMRGIEVQDAVGLAVADRAQHDRLGLQRAGHRMSYYTK